MNNKNTTLATKTGLSTLERPKFGPGMLLQHGDLELLNSYTRELSRLMFRSLFGCGVVCGLVVESDTRCDNFSIKVKSGVALACSGDPVYVPRDETIPITDDCETEIDGPLWVVLCGTVKCCSPRPPMCPDDDDSKPECTREKEGYVIKVIRGERPPCVCGCDENDPGWTSDWNPDCKCVNPALVCYRHHYNGDCGCECDDCSDCKCDCILLAKLTENGEKWDVDYRVRRFVRPVLIRDPLVVKDEEEEEQPDTQVVLNEQEVQRVYLTTVKVSAPEVAQKTVDSTVRVISKLFSEKIGPQETDAVMRQFEPSEIASAVAKDAIQMAEERVKLEPVEVVKESDLGEIKEKLTARAKQPGQVATSKAEAKKKQANPKKSRGGTQ